MVHTHFSDPAFEKCWRNVYNGLIKLNKKLDSVREGEEKEQIRQMNEQAERLSSYKGRLKRIYDFVISQGGRSNSLVTECCEPSDQALTELETKIRGNYANVDYATKVAFLRGILNECQKYQNWIDHQYLSASQTESLVSSPVKKVIEEYTAYVGGNDFIKLSGLCPFTQNDREALLGTYCFPIPIRQEYLPSLPAALNRYLVIETDDILLKVCRKIPDVALFKCSSSKTGDDILRSVFSYLHSETEKDLRQLSANNGKLPHWRFVILDLKSLFDTSLGFLMDVSGAMNSAYASPACHSAEEANKTLDDLWTLLHSNSPDAGSPRSIILRGDGFSQDKVRRLVDNAEKLRLQIIIIDEGKNSEIPSYLTRNDAAVFVENDDGYLCPTFCGGRFSLSVQVKEVSLTASQKESIITATKPIEISYNYFDYADTTVPYLTENGYSESDTNNRNLRLLYGVADDGTKCIFNTNDNEKMKGSGGSSAFIVGSTGSGKSTLIHTLISSIVLNYHPDDVELWLVDFKMKEFSRYIPLRLPHVKYVLLDESEDMVCSLLDELTAEMKRRQRLIALYKAGWYQNIPHVPVLIAIIDEFSRMSQAIAEKYEYEIKLQNLFTQGRDQGIRIILSSQSYTKGVSALNLLSKQQIGIRIAMTTNDKEEMIEELALPRRMNDTEEMTVRLLPRFKAVERKMLVSGDARIQKANVLFFNTQGQKKLDEQYARISSMKPAHSIEELERLRKQYPQKAGEFYLDKEFVSISGDPSLLPCFDDCIDDFEADLIKQKAKALNREGNLWLWLGRSRRLERTSSIHLQKQDDENMLIISNYAIESDQYAGLNSIVQSILRSCSAVSGQKYQTQIWASAGSCLPLDEWAKYSTVITDVNEMTANARFFADLVETQNDLSTVLLIADPDEIFGSQKRALLKERYSRKSGKNADPAGNPPKGTTAISADMFTFDFMSKPKTAAKTDESAGDTLNDLIPYLIVAGSAKGLHIVIIGKKLSELLSNPCLPGDSSKERYSFFRHRIAFRLEEKDDQTTDWILYSSRNQLKDNLSDCFAYKNEQYLKIREPYRL